MSAICLLFFLFRLRDAQWRTHHVCEFGIVFYCDRCNISYFIVWIELNWLSFWFLMTKSFTPYVYGETFTLDQKSNVLLVFYSDNRWKHIVKQSQSHFTVVSNCSQLHSLLCLIESIVYLYEHYWNENLDDNAQNTQMNWILCVLCLFLYCEHLFEHWNVQLSQRKEARTPPKRMLFSIEWKTCGAYLVIIHQVWMKSGNDCLKCVAFSIVGFLDELVVYFFFSIRFFFQWGESSPSSVGFSCCQRLSSGSSIYNETLHNEHAGTSIWFFYFFFSSFWLWFRWSEKWMWLVIDRVCCWWTFFSCLQFTDIQLFGRLFYQWDEMWALRAVVSIFVGNNRFNRIQIKWRLFSHFILFT